MSFKSCVIFFFKNFHQFQNSSEDAYISPITEHSYPFSRFCAFPPLPIFVVIYSTHRKIHKIEKYSSIIYHKYNMNLSPTDPPLCSRNRVLQSQVSDIILRSLPPQINQHFDFYGNDFLGFPCSFTTQRCITKYQGLILFVLRMCHCFCFPKHDFILAICHPIRSVNPEALISFFS